MKNVQLGKGFERGQPKQVFCLENHVKVIIIMIVVIIMMLIKNHAFICIVYVYII